MMARSAGLPSCTAEPRFPVVGWLVSLAMRTEVFVSNFSASSHPLCVASIGVHHCMVSLSLDQPHLGALSESWKP